MRMRMKIGQEDPLTSRLDVCRKLLYGTILLLKTAMVKIQVSELFAPN
jgi:hypothetical protein